MDSVNLKIGDEVEVRVREGTSFEVTVSGKRGEVIALNRGSVAVDLREVLPGLHDCGVLEESTGYYFGENMLKLISRSDEEEVEGIGLGDIVRVKSELVLDGKLHNLLGEVVNIDSSASRNRISVDFKNEMHGLHMCRDILPSGTGYYLDEVHLEIVSKGEVSNTRVTEVPEFPMVGQRVMVNNLVVGDDRYESLKQKNLVEGWVYRTMNYQPLIESLARGQEYVNKLTVTMVNDEGQTYICESGELLSVGEPSTMKVMDSQLGELVMIEDTPLNYNESEVMRQGVNIMVRHLYDDKYRESIYKGAKEIIDNQS